MIKITSKIVFLSIIFTLILLLTLGVYNPYHHLNAEKIVRTSGGFGFDRERGDVKLEITEVKYLGRNTYLVHYENTEDRIEETVVLRIKKKSKYHTETDVFKYEFTRDRLGH